MTTPARSVKGTTPLGKWESAKACRHAARQQLLRYREDIAIQTRRDEGRLRMRVYDALRRSLADICKPGNEGSWGCRFRVFDEAIKTGNSCRPATYSETVMLYDMVFDSIEMGISEYILEQGYAGLPKNVPPRAILAHIRGYFDLMMQLVIKKHVDECAPAPVPKK